MKQTLFTKQLTEYFNVYLPLNKKCLKILFPYMQMDL